MAKISVQPPCRALYFTKRRNQQYKARERSMAENDLEKKVEELRIELRDLRDAHAQVLDVVKGLSDVVKKKMPHDQFDTFTHNSIDTMARDFKRS